MTQKSLHWAKASKQSTICFLVLDYSKAYDKVSRRFLVLVYKKVTMKNLLIGLDFSLGMPPPQLTLMAPQVGISKLREESGRGALLQLTYSSLLVNFSPILSTKQ